MNHPALWNQELYRETTGLVILFLLVVGAVLFVLRQRNPKFTTAWVSVKSWIFTAPILLFFAGLPAPWPLVVLGALAIYAAKTFYRMVGMYHRTWFVLLTYLFVAGVLAMVYTQKLHYFNLMPMGFLVACCFVPLLRNSYTHMIQYIALSLLCFIFIGWGFLHLGLMLHLPKGIYIVLYLYLLAEFSYSATAFFGRLWGKHKILDKVAPKMTIEGLVFSIFITFLLAWGMRHMLPVRSEPFWLSAAIITEVFGRCGDLILSVIRRDLGIKDTGVFIIGRDDILARVGKFIFTAPIYYYVLLALIEYFPSK